MQDAGRWIRATLIAFLVLSVGFAPRSVWAQGTVTGAIKGTVSDPSGAVVVGASVVITDVETNVSKTLTTDGQGSYSLPNLAISTYTVQVSSAGFSSERRENVKVSVGKDSIIDVSLTRGEANQTVTVQAQPPVAITEDKGDRSVVLAAETLMQLPIQISSGARQPDAFLTLAPGVTGDTFSARINGAPNFSQDFYYDGVPYMNADGGGRQEGGGAPFETVDEYAINTNAYSAQYGRSTGQLDFHIRSGTNRLHGSAWEILRNNVFDAPGYFAKKANTEKQNEYGFKVGGPVRIPWIYNGIDKTFFFGEMGWYKFRGGSQNQQITLPTAKMLTGDFSELPYPIYDPNTTRPDGKGGFTRDPFPGNKIDPSRLSSVTAAYLPLIPLATGSGIINNAVVPIPAAPINNFNFLVKIDHNISTKLILHGSYYYVRAGTPTTPLITGVLGSGNNFASLFYEPRLTLDQNISSKIYNQTAFSVQYTKGARSFYPTVPSSFNSPIATPGQPYPAIDIQGLPQLGSGADNGQVSGGCYPCVFIADSLKVQAGRHALSFGTEIRFEDESDSFARNLGTYGFSNATTAKPDDPNFGSTGWAFASFYLGVPTSASRTGVADDRQVKTGYKAFYAQDDIKINSRLTINAGLRYDVSTPVYDKLDKFSTFDPTVPNPDAGGILGSLVYTGMSGGPCIANGGASLCRKQVADTYYGNWQPRVGFAFRANPTTVVRGGFGKATLRGGANTLMGPDIAAGYLTGFQSQQSLSSQDNIGTPPPGLPKWDLGLPPIPALPPRTRGLANGLSPDYMQRIDGRDGYTMNWSATVEQELPYRFVLETSYVGSSNVRIGSSLLNANQVPSKFLSLGSVLQSQVGSPEANAAGITAPYPGFTGSVQQALRPFPQYNFINEKAQINGHSTYHALQMRAQKNFSDHLSALISFTWAKNITNASDQFSTFNALPLDTGNRRLEKAPLNGLANGAAGPLVLSMAGTYDLPIGPGQKFLNSHGAASRVVGGWSVSTLLTYDDGGFLPIGGGSPNPLFNGGPRPNRVSGVPAQLFHGGKFHPGRDIYLNAAAFSDAGQFALGNAPPVLSDARDFPLLNENFSVLKRFLIWRESNLIFRTDFFNAFNRTRFGAPDTNFNDVANGGFGTISGQRNQPRVIQFGLRVDF